MDDVRGELAYGEMAPDEAAEAVDAYLDLARKKFCSDRSFLWLEALKTALSAAPSDFAVRRGNSLSVLEACSYPDKHRLLAARILCGFSARSHTANRPLQPLSHDKANTLVFDTAVKLCVCILDSSESGSARNEALLTLSQIGTDECLEAIAQYAAGLIQRRGLIVAADLYDEENLITAIEILDSKVNRGNLKKMKGSGCIFPASTYTLF